MLPTSSIALDRDGRAQAGDLVRTREALWRVTHVRDGRRDVRVVSLRGADDRNRWQECTLLEPFDRLVRRATRSRRPRVVSRRRWMRALRQLVASTDAGAGTSTELGPGLGTLADARVSLLPHQLEPLLAILGGVASRVLIADGVGLGKTIQAALVLRVLATRGQAGRVLIVVPAGLREQWQRELRARVGLESHIIDAATLGARVRELPADINPWTQAGLIITSLDFIKQEIVLHGVAAVVWDLLIVDEAHALTVGTDRAAAADHLARHSRIVLLLTATPHDGSDTAFNALCRLGQHTTTGAGASVGAHANDPIAIFHRSRHSLGLPTARRVHVLRVQPTPAERYLHDLLSRYTRRVEREHPIDEPAALAMTVLRKRACSSAWSLLQSLERRLMLLSSTDPPSPTPPAPLPPPQPALPFDADAPEIDADADAETETAAAASAQTDADAIDADAAPQTVLAAPGLSNAHNERAWLSLLIQAAHRAMPRESKLRALHRLLRRIHEPAIVYTEYRDTLTHILDTLPDTLSRRRDAIATLHGGLPRDAREESLHRFSTGTARILLATDAAGEGLNLQQRCRLVINIELPWNPNRLEQRLGRVDRLGQSRTVHATHLVLTDTPEEPLLHTLTTRATHITKALTTTRDTTTHHACPAPASQQTEAPDRIWPDLRTEASKAVQALEHLRILRTAPAARSPKLPQPQRPDAAPKTPERPRGPRAGATLQAQERPRDLRADVALQASERPRGLRAGATPRGSEALGIWRAGAGDGRGGVAVVAVGGGSCGDLEIELDARSPWVAEVRRCRHRGPLDGLGLGPGVLCVWRTRVRICSADSASSLARVLITPIHVGGRAARVDGWPVPVEVMEGMRGRLDALALEAIERWREEECAFWQRVAARGLGIGDAMRALGERGGERQAVLFVDIAAERDVRFVDRWRAPPPEAAAVVAGAGSGEVQTREPAPAFEHALVLVLVIR